MRSSLVTLVLLMAPVGRGGAQPAVLDVRSNDTAAHVFADSTWLGTAASSPWTVTPGDLEVRIVPSAVGTWGVATQVALVHVTPGDTVVVDARFPHVYRLESIPSALVTLDRSQGGGLLGTTPLVYHSDGPESGVFRVEREGFVPQLVQPGGDLWNVHSVTLERLDDPTAKDLGISVESGGRTRRWIDYAAVGLAATAGVVAVYYKRKADRRFDVYRETGDPALRPAIDRYDRYSAVALGAMQVGVGVFAIRLALR